MNEANKKGPIFDPGICRCCGSSKKCRLLTAHYEWMGLKEIYADLLFDCLGLMLSNLDGEDDGKLICATCVMRLRDANMFKKQVLEQEELLLQNQMQLYNDPDKTEIKEEYIEDKISDEELLESSWSDDGKNKHRDIDSNIETSVPVVKRIKRKGKLKNPMRRSVRCAKMDAVCDKRSENGLERKNGRSQTREKIKTVRSNTLTIIENSYVCPFSSSFSDFYCIYCRKEFSNPTSLREHTWNHDPKTYKEIEYLKKPLQIDISRIDCRLCSANVPDIKTLKDHLKLTHDLLIYDRLDEFVTFRLGPDLKCLECDASFSYFHALKNHMADHFGTCICDICGAHYFEERLLVVHQKTHHQTLEVFRCSGCDKSFSSKHSLYLHEARTHRNEPTYACQKCDATFMSYVRRYRHLIDSHGVSKVFKCDLCDRSYDTRKSLREHNRKNHLRISKHQCNLCDRRFYLPSELKEHMVVHTGERNYRCQYCGKSYPRLRGLKVHLQTHSDVKRFKCGVCEATFTQNVSLKNHMKRHCQDSER